MKASHDKLNLLHQRVCSLLESEKELSRRDHLTGALNIRALEEKMHNERSRARRMGQKTSLLYIDLDHFKMINDTYGHPYGDKMLQAVVSIIQKNIRDIDQVARLGGDEFAVLLPQIDQKNAENCARRILDHLNRDIPRPLTASIGMILFGDVSESNAALIKKADDAMYDAKHSGRNTVVFVDHEMALNTARMN